MKEVSRKDLAMNGGRPARTRPFPSWPVWGEEEVEALAQVCRSGAWGSTAGNQVVEFEEIFAAYQHARFCVCCVNGTAALAIALRAIGIMPGDEVIVPPYTFIATASACVTVGAIPVFVDIDPRTLNIDPACIEPAITPRTKAVIVVHLGGLPCDMDAVMEISARRGLKVIEDGAQAHGAEWAGRRVGAIGHVGTFSFQSSKNLTAGEGGAVTTNDQEIYDRAWSLTNVGRVREGAWYQHRIIGWNNRLTEWQGAVLNAQFRRLEEQNARRTRVAARLRNRLAGMPGFLGQPLDSRVTRHAYHLFPFTYDRHAFGGLSRNDFVRALQAEGIPASTGYVPLHREEAFLVDPVATRLGDFSRVSCPVAEEAAAERAGWLPQNVLLGEEADADDVADAISKIQAAHGR